MFHPSLSSQKKGWGYDRQQLISWDHVCGMSKTQVVEVGEDSISEMRGAPG